MTPDEIVNQLRMDVRIITTSDAENVILMALRRHMTCAADMIVSQQTEIAQLAAEKNAVADERDALMRRHAKQVEVIRHKIDCGGLTPDEQSLLDDLMLPRHYDRCQPAED